LRIHIPVITNPNVFFTCGDASVHMTEGECWTFDSFQMHNVRNGGAEKRIHLVLDTVGGEELWDLIDEAQGPGGAGELSPVLQPGSGNPVSLAFERVDAQRIMSPWELSCHIDFIAAHAPSGDKIDAIMKRLGRFAAGWNAAWAQFGASDEGLPAYRRLIDIARSDVKAMGAGTLLLSNEVPLDRALGELVFNVALPPVPSKVPNAGANMVGVRPAPVASGMSEAGPRL
jgi:hypothetical protein